jgi:formylglycine-generating enzyme required for sulfatase activity
MSPGDPLHLVGTVVAEKYRVERLVAEGGFALLYRATHQIWKRPVALKVFKALGDASRANKETLLASFIREGALLADLSERSASICQARDVGMLLTKGGEMIPFMVLEWLEGSSLEFVLKDEIDAGLPPRSLDETMRLLGPVGEALALAHTLGVVHRDVKPANIFLLGDPRGTVCPVKLLDFGIAKVVMDAQKAEGAFASTTGEMTAFTPSYAAPEQFSRTHGPTGPWTDTFALALVLTECVTGKQALGGDDFLQIAYTATNPSSRPTPATLGAHVSDEVDAVFERALAVQTTARYATVGEFWNALRVAMGQEPMSIVVPSSWVGTPSSPRSALPPSGLRRSSPPGSLPSASGPDFAQRAGASALDRPRGVATATDRRLAVLFSLGGAVVSSAMVAGAAAAGLHYWHTSTVPAAGPVTSSSAVPPIVPSGSASAAPRPAKCPDGMVHVPAGQFFMGSDDGLATEKPSHNVRVAPFCIDVYEVTTARYVTCSDEGKCKRASKVNEWPGITAADRKSYDPLCNANDPARHANEPINCVDWDRASTFCGAHGGRLPTEAEWEYAARGSDGRQYPWGDEPPSAKYLNACGSECVAWGRAHGVAETPMYKQDDGWPTTAPVGSFPAGKSRFGLMDVVGNVWEWVADWYAPYADGPTVNPHGPTTGTKRVMRGGAWNGADPSWVRPTFRFMNDPGAMSYGVGFRCAADPR